MTRLQRCRRIGCKRIAYFPTSTYPQCKEHHDEYTNSGKHLVDFDWKQRWIKLERSQ